MGEGVPATGGNPPPRGGKKYFIPCLALPETTHILSLENGFVLLVSSHCPPEATKKSIRKQID